jgi:hypothetical protein
MTARAGNPGFWMGTGEFGTGTPGDASGLSIARTDRRMERLLEIYPERAPGLAEAVDIMRGMAE